MPKITGSIEVLVNGNPILNKEGWTASGIGISGEPSYEVEGVYGDTGYHGYVEKPVQPECSGNVSDREDQLLDTLARIRDNGTVIFRARNGGKAYVMEGATCARNFSVSSPEGETAIKFFGPFWTELVQ